MSSAPFNNIYKDKVVLVTGHTGFKGSWLALWLLELGAKVIGFSIDEGAEQGVFQLARLKQKITHVNGDVRNLSQLQQAFTASQPEIVFHLAAQALVRQSYEDPVTTFETNILGTVNVLECIKQSNSVKTAILITSDKCYKNKEWLHGYRENDELGGDDPYSASKGAAELIIWSYWNSFLCRTEKKVASVRAGNVIGGGDWSENRIIPDTVKALSDNKPIIVRNPHSIRPWQHVFEPLYGYLLLGLKLQNEGHYCGAWNFGPAPDSLITVHKIVTQMIEKWGSGTWEEQQQEQQQVHNYKKESKFLNLDSSKAHLLLGWSCVLDMNTTLDLVVDWYKQYPTRDVYELCREQLNDYGVIRNGRET